jgi:phosphatidylglycerol:prolipoprotein diacylglycerol transferase
LPSISLSALTFPDIDPVLLQIGPLAVHWYGVAYIAGILFGWWYSKRLVSNPRLWADGQAPMKPVDLDDLVTWATLGIILGGRLGYVLFYNPAHYLANPADIIAIWDGGMSFHGGFLGTTVAMIFFARSRGIPMWSLFDVIAASVPVAFGLVRVTNFINAELWGRPTDVSWAVVFCNDRIASLPANGGFCPAGMAARHPSQLYEAVLEGLVLFLLLRVLTHVFLKLKRPGFVAGAFVAWYGLARIFVEFFREPDRQLGYLSGGWLTMGMVLSLPMVLAGIWAMATARPASAPRTE